MIIFALQVGVPPSLGNPLFIFAGDFPSSQNTPWPALKLPPVPGQAKNPLIKFICKLKYFAQIQSLPRVRVWRVEKRTFSENAFLHFCLLEALQEQQKKEKGQSS